VGGVVEAKYAPAYHRGITPGRGGFPGRRRAVRLFFFA